MADGTGLIIFDCDGVLIDSERIACEVEARALTEQGVPMEPHALARFAGTTTREMYRILEQETGVRLPPDYVANTREKLLAAFISEGDSLLVPGVRETLDALAGRAMCVASSSSHERLQRTLGQVALWDRFAPNIFSATEVTHPKPAPDLFLHAATRMSVRPEQCVVIEDSVFGIQAARAAGMKALGFCGAGHCTAGHAERLLAAGAAVTFDRMSELPALLG
ncbi:MAG TPA: HAD family phosphatase [Alphaproteobacteria bacterium]|nr:HAD family phosphatase [Alphaproteobacteria bacterium]